MAVNENGKGGGRIMNEKRRISLLFFVLVMIFFYLPIVMLVTLSFNNMDRICTEMVYRTVYKLSWFMAGFWKKYSYRINIVSVFSICGNFWSNRNKMV